MRIQSICSMAAAAALLVGCSSAETRKHAGGPNLNDQNVLSGGPVVGTTLADLPAPVKHTLQQQMPTAEVADIDKVERNGKIVYEITFAEPGKNPTIYIAADGTLWSPSEMHK